MFILNVFYFSEIVVAMINGNRISSRPILSVIMRVIDKSSDFVDHSYDYRQNWTPLGPITIIYLEELGILIININLYYSCIFK